MVEISGVHVKLTGDSSNLNSALDDAQGELKDTQKDAEDTSKSLRGMGKAFLGAAAAAAGIVGVGSLFRSVASEGQKFETSMLKINAIIKATGGAAGKTGEELRESARALALNTLESTEGVLAAQQRLLTFRNITGDVFDRTIAASADLAAAMGQDLSGASVMLGRALEDPVRGITALTRTGTVFTEQQKEMIKTLVESGDLQKAQTFILKELEDQYGGTAVAAAQGYAGALDTLGQRQQEFLLAINDTLRVTDALAVVVNGLANVFKILTDNIKRVISYIAATAIAAMIAFRGAIAAGALAITKLMIPALVGLRVALIRTGIGALIVGFGELIYQITRVVGFFQDLIKATGSISAAMSLLGEVIGEEFKKGISRLKVFGLEVKKFGLEVERSMAEAFADKMPEAVKAGARVMLRTFAGLRAAAGELFNAVFNAISLQSFDAPDLLEAFTEGFQEQIEGMFAEGDPVASITTGIARLEAQILDLEGAINRPNEALERMRALLAALREEGLPETNVPAVPVVDPNAAGSGTDPKEELKNRVDALRSALQQENATEYEMLVAKLATRAKLLDEAYAAEAIKTEEHLAALAELNENHTNSMAEIKQKEVDMVTSAQSSMFGELGNLFGMFASKSKAAALASIAINKALSIASIIQNTAAAQVRALAELGPILGPPAAAKIGAFGKIQAAIVAASGLTQAAGALSGGGGGTLSTMEGGGGQAPAPVSRNVAISVTGGDMFSRDQVVGLINQINEAVEDGAVVRLA